MEMTTMITPDQIAAEHERLWGEAIERHGDEYKVPPNEVQEISNVTRALYVLEGWNGAGSVARYLSSYSIPEDVIVDVLSRFCPEVAEEESGEIFSPRPRRSDKYDQFLDWAKDHVLEQFTTEQLVEQSGFSYPTTLKFVQESPVFRKIKKGLWEIRDPQADRESES